MLVFFELDIYYQTENCCSGGYSLLISDEKGAMHFN